MSGLELPWGDRVFPLPTMAVGLTDRFAAAVITHRDVYRLLLHFGRQGGWQFRFYDGAED